MMKFTCSVKIDSPKNKVAEIFTDPDNLQYVQEGFKSKTLISRNEGEDGAASKMVYEKLELIEQLLKTTFQMSF